MEPLKITVDPKYYPDIAKLFVTEMLEMKANGHPFRGLVNTDLYNVLHRLSAFKVAGGKILVFVQEQTREFAGALGYSILPVWWAKEGANIALVEEFVVGVYPGFGRIAGEFMKEHQKELGCSLIVSGNLLGRNPKMTENLYMRKLGFTFQQGTFCNVNEEVSQRAKTRT